jgi:hypothetical protein
MLSKSFFFPRNYENVKYRLGGSDYDTPYYTPPAKLQPFTPENIIEVQTHPNNESIGSYYGISWFEGFFGKAGVSEGEFLKPKGIDTDSEGNIFVADSENKRIIKFSQSGLFLEEWKLSNYSSNTGYPIANLNLFDLVIDRSTDNVIVSTDNGVIIGFRSDASYIRLRKDTRNAKTYLNLSNGILYVYTIGTILEGLNTVMRLFNPITIIEIPSIVLPNDYYLDFCVTSLDEIVILSDSGNLLQNLLKGWSVAIPNSAFCLAIDASDNIYVATKGFSERFLVYDTNGVFLRSFGDIDFFTNQLATDGNLIVSDAYYNRVSVLDPNDGSFVSRAYLDGQGYSTALTEADLPDFDADLTDRYGVDADTQIPEYIYFTPLKTLVADLMEEYNTDFTYQDTTVDTEALTNFASYAKKTPYGIKKIQLRCTQQEDEQLRFPIIWFRTNKDGSELLKRLLPAKYRNAKQNNPKIYEMVLDKPYLVDNITYLNFEVVGDESILEVFLAEREATMDIIRFMLARYGDAVDDYNTLITPFTEPEPTTTGGIETIIWYNEIQTPKSVKNKIIQAIEDLTTSADTPKKTSEKPEEFWQKWWFWAILIIILIIIILNKKK